MKKIFIYLINICLSMEEALIIPENIEEEKIPNYIFLNNVVKEYRLPKIRWLKEIIINLFLIFNIIFFINLNIDLFINLNEFLNLSDLFKTIVTVINISLFLSCIYNTFIIYIYNIFNVFRFLILNIIYHIFTLTFNIIFFIGFCTLIPEDIDINIYYNIISYYILDTTLISPFLLILWIRLYPNLISILKSLRLEIKYQNINFDDMLSDNIIDPVHVDIINIYTNKIKALKALQNEELEINNLNLIEDYNNIKEILQIYCDYY